jgi:hypothetical protein
VARLGCSTLKTLELNRDGARVAEDSLRGAEQGEGRIAKPFYVEAERKEAEGGLAAKWSGWWYLVLVEIDRERVKSSIEGRRRCGMLQGRVSPFLGPGGGSGGGERQWKCQSSGGNVNGDVKCHKA